MSVPLILCCLDLDPFSRPWLAAPLANDGQRASQRVLACVRVRVSGPASRPTTRQAQAQARAATEGGEGAERDEPVGTSWQAGGQAGRQAGGGTRAGKSANSFEFRFDLAHSAVGRSLAVVKPSRQEAEAEAQTGLAFNISRLASAHSQRRCGWQRRQRRRGGRVVSVNQHHYRELEPA